MMRITETLKKKSQPLDFGVGDDGDYNDDVDDMGCYCDILR